MARTSKMLIVFILALLALSIPTAAQKDKKEEKSDGKKKRQPSGPAALWREPADLSSRNLLYGQGGAGNQPRGKFTFVEEDAGGSNPKFEVRDERGQKWKVKLGQEAQSETAATRLLWAAGYFTDEDYYLPELRVEGLTTLKRGAELIQPGGLVRGARLERDIKGEKKVGNWNWFDNPFVGTKEFNGLRVLMALINNWDLKEDNNSVYDGPGPEQRYVVSDLGATFGRTGNTDVRTRSVVSDYAASPFIEKNEAGEIDFVLHSRPKGYFFFYGPYYRERAGMEKIVDDIPRADAKWLGQLLSRLSDEQLGDAFRAGGYSAPEVAGFTKKVRERIAELNRL